MTFDQMSSENRQASLRPNQYGPFQCSCRTGFIASSAHSQEEESALRCGVSAGARVDREHEWGFGRWLFHSEEVCRELRDSEWRVVQWQFPLHSSISGYPVVREGRLHL